MELIAHVIVSLIALGVGYMIGGSTERMRVIASKDREKKEALERIYAKWPETRPVEPIREEEEKE